MFSFQYDNRNEQTDEERDEGIKLFSHLFFEGFLNTIREQYRGYNDPQKQENCVHNAGSY